MSLPPVLLELARDTAVEAQKFAALVSAYDQERIRKAEAAFLAAFLKMKPHLPVIDERGTIEYRDGRRGSYALNEDIQLVIEPILRAYGFTLTFETEHPSPNAIRVTGLLTHRRGHTRRSAFESPTDTSGGKSGPQGRGSIMSYGHRYCTMDLLNLVTRGADNDGDVATAHHVISAGLLAQFPNLVNAAPRGMAALETEWRTLGEENRSLVPADEWQTLKEIASLKDTANAVL